MRMLFSKFELAVLTGFGRERPENFTGSSARARVGSSGSNGSLKRAGIKTLAMAFSTSVKDLLAGVFADSLKVLPLRL